MSVSVCGVSRRPRWHGKAVAVDDVEGVGGILISLIRMKIVCAV